MPELSNCKFCGKIFVRTTTSICPTCRKEHEEMFEKVYAYIRKQENREATVYQVHEETGVDEVLIQDWIKEGRLKTADFPQLGYPCRSCGQPIQTGKFCDSCGKQLHKDLSTFNDQQLTQKAEVKTYFTKK